MTTPRTLLWAVLLAALAATGCGGVSRRFVIESNVPNAQVYIDDKPVGPAPAHAQFEYYGHYTITLVHPGYEPLRQRVNVAAPWYSYPPFDFLAEVVWPFKIEDVRRHYFELVPAQQIPTDELINNADALRQRGWNLRPPSRPDTPRDGGPPGPILGPPVGPPGATPLPPPTPLPGPGAPPGGTPLPPPNPLVPSVAPSAYGPSGTFLR
jgi:hypothetical protein